VERALERGVVTIVPRATYRLQLRAGFGFNEAAAIAPYLARLGVSHVYLSPFFKARPGSVWPSQRRRRTVLLWRQRAIAEEPPRDHKRV